MDAILLAAGYATRLYPLTRERAKPLLPVGGRPIIDHLVDRLEAAPQVERLLVVTNDRFAADFDAWADGRVFSKPVQIINDGTRDNESRLGAVSDVALALREGAVGGRSAYVLATDNLPRFDLTDIIALAEQKAASAVFVCPVNDPGRLRRVGVAEVGADGRVISFEEKPQRPRGNLRVPPFYVYTAEALGLVEQFLAEGNNPDAPGHLLAWLVGRLPVYALRRDEGTYDIGTLESYRRVCAEFGARPCMP